MRTESRSRLEPWRQFVLSRSHVLRAAPGLLIQEAANWGSDAGSAVSTAARACLERTARPWLERRNPARLALPCLLTLSGHLDGVASCDISPDGQRVASTSRDGTLRIWDAAAGKERLTLPASAEMELYGPEVRGCRFSPDGQLILFVSDAGRLTVWDVSADREVCLLSTGRLTVTRFAFSPDGKRIVAGTRDGSLLLFDAKRGRRLLSLRRRQISPVMCCRLSPDGRLLAAGSMDNTVRIWDLKTRTVCTVLRHTDEHRIQTGHVRDCAFLPDGESIVTAHDDGLLRIWNVDDPDSARQFWFAERHSKIHQEGLHACAVSPDGTMAASASRDGSLVLWDVAQREPVAAFQEHARAVTDCAFSADGRCVVSASEDGTLKILDVALARASGSRELLEGPVVLGSFAPTSDKAVSATEFNTVIVWNTRTHEVLHRFHHYGELSVCNFSQDGRYLAFASNKPFGQRDPREDSEDDRFSLYDVETGQRLPLFLPGTSGQLSCVEFSPDGRLIVGSSKGGTVTCALPGGVVVAHRDDQIVCCAFTPDGGRVFSGVGDTFHAWDPKTGATLLTLGPDVNLGRVSSCRCSSDGRRVVSASGNGVLVVWDAETGIPTRMIEVECRKHREPLRCGFARDDGRVFVGGPEGVFLVDEREGRSLRITCLPPGELSPNLEYLLTATEPALLQVLRSPGGNTLAGFYVDGGITAMAWSPDSGRIMVGSGSGDTIFLALHAPAREAAAQ